MPPSLHGGVSVTDLNRPSTSGRAVMLVLAAAASTQFGSAVAVLLVPRTGAMGVVTLRLVLAAIVLVMLSRPRLHGRTRGDWWAVVGFGVSLAGMNSLLYESITRIPLGAAVTIEVLGPLVLSVVASRRWIAGVWAVLAFAGVVALSGGGDAEALDPVGVAFAAGAAVMWASYIVCGARVSRRWERTEGLAVAMVVAAVLVAPVGVLSAGASMVSPVALGIGAAVALMSSVLPYSMELQALRHVPPAVFSILMSLAPAVAALSGFIVLGQSLGWVQVGGIALVIAASMGAVRSGRRV